MSTTICVTYLIHNAGEFSKKVYKIGVLTSCYFYSYYFVVIQLAIKIIVKTTTIHLYDH